jgi:hypothetical protein
VTWPNLFDCVTHLLLANYTFVATGKRCEWVQFLPDTCEAKKLK